MSLPDILLLLFILLLAALAVVFILRQRKRGGTCSGGCSGCPQAGGCAKQPPEVPGGQITLPGEAARAKPVQLHGSYNLEPPPESGKKPRTP